MFEEIVLKYTPFEKKVWLSSPTMHGDELKYMKLAYDTNWMSTLGENVNKVVEDACAVTGCKYAVPLSCGTAALHMAAKACRSQARRQSVLLRYDLQRYA